MRRIVLLITIALMVAFLTGCKVGSPKSVDKRGLQKKNETTSVIKLEPKKVNVKPEVSINILREIPKSLEESNTISIKGLLEGEEYVEIVIKGEITDFEHIEIAWDEKTSTLVEKSVLEKFNSVKDQTIIIKTYLPDGIPSEKIKWRDQEGITSEYILKENTKGE